MSKEKDRKEFQGLFGMSEMEDAAYRICKEGFLEGTFTINIMETEKERIGFTELIQRGWFVKEERNGQYSTDQFFKDRVQEIK